MGISASHLDSLSVIATPDATGSAASRPKAPPSADPQAAEFRRLFARVFGQQMRQESAGSAPASADRTAIAGHGAANPAAAKTLKGPDPEGPENPETSEGREGPTHGLEPLRSLQIGRATQIITAGPPLAEEDLVRFAREAELDEASIAALMAHQTAQPTNADEISDASTLTPVSPFSLPFGLATHTLLEGGAVHGAGSGGATGQAGLLPSAASQASGVAGSAAQALSASQALSRPAGPANGAFAVSVSASPSAVADQPLSANTWMLSRAANTEGLQASEMDGLASSTANEEALSLEGAGKDFISEKALALKLAFRDGSVKERLMKLLGPEALRAAQDGKPQWARLESISLLEHPEAAAGVGLDGTTPQTSGLSSAASTSAASLGSGMGSGGQGGGAEGGRPDPNAQSGQARGLPQQVMQRFGELLGQRLLQQVSQGNWRVELDLEPGDLGSIRIELELRKGEIEASIKASQASTRELLQESLPRLRETLERNGMDVASLSVGQQDRRQSGGQSSSGRHGSGQQALAEDSSAEAVTGASQSSRLDDGRLDVWA